MPNDSLTLRQAVVLGFLTEDEFRAALDRSGDASQALAELVTSGRLSAAQIDRARSQSDVGQATLQAQSTPTLVSASAAPKSAPSDSGSFIGRVIGDCRIDAPLGAGGMGAVFRARHLGLDKSVALKILPPHFADRKDLVDRFHREARAVAKLDHPNIVGVLNVGREKDLHFIVMPIVEGRSLADRLSKGAMPADEVMRMGRGIAEGLAEAHRNGIVHRDVKPDNVLLAASGAAKLIDFGLAREGEVSVLTEAGQLLGTPHYMSPEQCRGEAADARSDVYSLGATLYHALTGRLPHEAQSLYQLMEKVVKTRPAAPGEVVAAVPAGLSKFVMWMMEPDPARRAQTMDEVARGLAALERGSIVNVPAAEAPRRAAFPVAAVVLVVVLIAVGWVAWKLKGDPSPGTSAEGTKPPVAAGVPGPVTVSKKPVPAGHPRSSLRIDIEPDGATATLDTEYGTETLVALNSTCQFNNVPVGQAKLRVSAPGHDTYETDIEIHAGGNAARYIPLDPIAAEVWIDTTPAGASIILDGKPLEEVTPCKLKKVAFGEHKVVLVLSGHADMTETFRVATSELIRLRFELKTGR